MKVYLSKSWVMNTISFLVIVLSSVCMTIFVWVSDDFSRLYILKFSVLVMTFGLYYLFLVGIKLCRYVIKNDNEIIMYSFGKKRLCTVNIHKDIYYEVLSLRETSSRSKDFIIISNEPFTHYKGNRYPSLIEACKMIDANGKQVIIPYSEKNHLFRNLNGWHLVY